MKIYDIIKGAIPNADESLCEYLLWGRTAYPFGKITARTIYKAANRYRRAKSKNLRLCEFCDRIAEANTMVCQKCHIALTRDVL